MYFTSMPMAPRVNSACLKFLFLPIFICAILLHYLVFSVRCQLQTVLKDRSDQNPYTSRQLQDLQLLLLLYNVFNCEKRRLGKAIQTSTRTNPENKTFY